jgi:hypothetical protein
LVGSTQHGSPRPPQDATQVNPMAHACEPLQLGENPLEQQLWSSPPQVPHVPSKRHCQPPPQVRPPNELQQGWLRAPQVTQAPFWHSPPTQLVSLAALAQIPP